ncbi:UDP-N-acetylmuramate--L-alanine ligase [Candidatus Parcubacteria bacterium]|nr:UDP-N-acetylmuramate--L-alanine ligase [Candidatus Parcubacteria bacterium]
MKLFMSGIGGIGMSALAQLYAAQGHEVIGSDRALSPTTELLERKGIRVLIVQRAENVPDDANLLIYSDAVPDSNPERVRARELCIPQRSYFEALGEVSKSMTTIAVAGTHGKTTTTAMLVKILKDAGKNPTAIIGSIVKDFGSNFVEGDPNLLVVEACEYRDHLLELSPKYLVITNMEWDHTDWFTTEAQMRQTFQKAIDAVPSDGKVIDETVYTHEPEYELSLIGEFNQDNARAAAAAARVAFPDITEETIRASLKSFQGTWRRFELKGTSKNGAAVYDDYAHHPTAVSKTIDAVREKFPDKQIVVAFHPHLYTRTRDFMNEFSTALATADEVFVAPIFGAREEPIDGITSEVLAEKIRLEGGHAEHLLLEAIGERLSRYGADTLIITMGAGDIYKVADALIKK